MQDKPKLSIGEYATLLGGFARVAFVVVKSALTASFRGQDGAPTFKRQVLYTLNGALLETFTARQLHAVMPSTSDAYKAFAKRKGLTPELVDICNGVKGCWVGDKDASTVLVWFHGGCFVLGANQELFDMLASVINEAKLQGIRLAALVAEYDLAPEAAYPRQLEQAAATLHYLTATMGKPYSHLLVGGDSAGGHLALGLMSHISHPHPGLARLESSGNGLRGVMLVSPWVTFDQNAPSFTSNKSKDNLTRRGLEKWSNAYMSSAEDDFYNAPLSAPGEWWQNLPAESVLVLAGADELMVDDIRDITQKLKEHNGSRIELLVADHEPHNDSIFRRTQGISLEDCVSQRVLSRWILEHA